MTKTKLFILDDHQMFIDGIKALLSKDAHYHIIGEATKATTALDLIRANNPDIILSDINLPEMSGVEFTRLVLKEFPKIKVLALSMSAEKYTISEMLDAGASGYILKNTGRDELVSALQKIANGEMFFSDEVSAEMMKAINQHNKQQEQTVNLTHREKEIIKLIAQEYSNAQIGEKLFISERTVESHRKNIFRKTNTKTVVGLIKFVIENKLD